MLNMLRATAIAALAAFVLGAPPAPAAEIEHRRADIISDGVRVNAHLFHPAAAAGKPLPVIIMSHGWGGTGTRLAIEWFDRHLKN